MSEQPTTGPDEDAAPQDVPQQDVPQQDVPLEDVPPVAGGTDDSPPAQGEGEDDSW